jgi:hypothetical protein
LTATQEQSKYLIALNRLRRPTALMVFITAIGAVLEATVLIAYSLFRYNHFDLGVDFALIDQATHLIAHGDLNPYSTIYGHPYLLDTFGLITWPLALLAKIFPSGIVLLIAQALCLAITTFLIVRIAIIKSNQLPPGYRVAIFVVTALLAFSSPWALEADSFDVHLEVFGALGLVLALSAAIEKRPLMAAIGLTIALSSSIDPIVNVIGLGLGLAVLASTRRYGLIYLLAGVATLVLSVVLNAHQGFSFTAQYGYLAAPDTGHPSAFAIVRSIVEHPTKPLSVLVSRKLPIAELIGYGGVLGLLFPPTLVPVLIDIPINGLTVAPNFISLPEGFQNWPEEALLLAGSALIAIWLLNRIPQHLKKTATFIWFLIWSAIGFQALFFDLSVPYNWTTTPPSAWHVLQLAVTRTPPTAETVATINIIGRFASRKSVFFVPSLHSTLPICSRQTTIVLLSGGGYAVLSPAQVLYLAHQLAQNKSLSQIAAGGGAYVFQINALPGRETLVLPEGHLIQGHESIAFDNTQCS